MRGHQPNAHAMRLILAPETDEQLQSHITNFNTHIANQKRGKREKEAEEQDMVAELKAKLAVVRNASESSVAK